MLFKFAQDIEISEGNFIYGGKKRNDNLAQKSVGKREPKAICTLPQLNPPFLFQKIKKDKS